MKMMTDREAMKRALDFLESGMLSYLYGMDKEQHQTAITAIRQALRKALAEPDMPIDRGAWSDVPDATKWVDELRGDDGLEEPPNSTTDVVEPEPASKTPKWICRTDGRCQYAIDSGAEGMGWCPEGKCVMPYNVEQPVSFYVYEWVNPSDGIVFRSFRHDEHHMGREPDRTIAVPAPHTCAAPDLLEALQYAIKHVPELASVPGIAAAIAKARGE